MLLNKKKQQTPFATSLFDWPSFIFCKLFSRRLCLSNSKIVLNKAHGHDKINIRMLKIYGSSSLYKPLEIIFKQCIETGAFPSEWKMGNYSSNSQKCRQTILKNYHPVSLLPICGKILERLLLNEMFKFLLKINLLHQISLVLNPLILALIRCYLSLMRYMDLLMWGLKLQAFSLIYPKYLIRCGMTVSSSS